MSFWGIMPSWVGVESHMASSFGLKCDSSTRHFIMPQEEALNSIKAPHTDGNSAALHSGR